MFTITLPQEYTLLSDLIQTTDYSKYKIQVIAGKVLAIEADTKPADYSRAGSSFTTGLYFTSTGAEGDLYVRAANPNTILYITPSLDGNFSSGISPFTGATGSGSGQTVSLVSAIAEDMFFNTTSARDTWTSGHPDRLEQGVACAVGTTTFNYYMWSTSDASWHAADLIYQGEKGDKGDKGDRGDGGNPVKTQVLAMSGKNLSSTLTLFDDTVILSSANIPYLNQSEITSLISANAPTESAASIKSKYESNTNTNAYTDADKSKVDGMNERIADAQSSAEAHADSVSDQALSDSKNYTDEEIGKINIPTVPVQSVNGKTGTIVLTSDDVDTYNKATIDAKVAAGGGGGEGGDTVISVANALLETNKLQTTITTSGGEVKSPLLELPAGGDEGGDTITSVSNTVTDNQITTTITTDKGSTTSTATDLPPSGDTVTAIANAVSDNRLTTTITTDKGTVTASAVTLPSGGGSGGGDVPDFSDVPDNTLVKIVSGELTPSSSLEVDGVISVASNSLEIGYHRIGSSVDNLTVTNKALGAHSLLTVQDVLINGVDVPWSWRVSGDYTSSLLQMQNGKVSLRDSTVSNYFMIRKDSISFTPDQSLSSCLLTVTINNEIGYKQKLTNLVNGVTYNVDLESPVIIDSTADIFLELETVRPATITVGIIPLEQIEMAYLERENGAQPLHSGLLTSLIDESTHALKESDFTGLSEEQALTKIRPYALVYGNRDWMVTSASVPWDTGFDDVIASRVDSSEIGLKHTIHLSRQKVPLVAFMRKDGSFIPFHAEGTVGQYDDTFGVTNWQDTDFTGITEAKIKAVETEVVFNDESDLVLARDSVEMHLTESGLDMKGNAIINCPSIGAGGGGDNTIVINNKTSKSLKIEGGGISTGYDENDQEMTIIFPEPSGGGGEVDAGIKPSGSNFTGFLPEFMTSDGMIVKSSTISASELQGTMLAVTSQGQRISNVEDKNQTLTNDMTSVKSKVDSLEREVGGFDDRITGATEGVAVNSNNIISLNEKVTASTASVSKNTNDISGIDNRTEIVENKLDTVADMLKIAALNQFSQANIDENAINNAEDEKTAANVIANGFFKVPNNHRFTLDVAIVGNLGGFLPNSLGGSLHVRNMNKNAYFLFICADGSHYEANVIGSEDPNNAIYRSWGKEANEEELKALRTEFDAFKSSMSDIIGLLSDTVDGLFNAQKLEYANNLLTSTMIKVDNSESIQQVTIESGGGGGGLPDASDPLTVYAGWTSESDQAIIDQIFIKTLDDHSNKTKSYEIAKNELIGKDIQVIRDPINDHIPFRHLFIAIPENAIDPMPNTVKSGDAPAAVWNTYMIPFNNTIYRVYMSTSENNLFFTHLQFGE